jgi:hypothetical protein
VAVVWDAFVENLRLSVKVNAARCSRLYPARSVSRSGWIATSWNISADKWSAPAAVNYQTAINKVLRDYLEGQNSAPH